MPCRESYQGYLPLSEQTQSASDTPVSASEVCVGHSPRKLPSLGASEDSGAQYILPVVGLPQGPSVPWTPFFWVGLNQILPEHSALS